MDWRQRFVGDWDNVGTICSVVNAKYLLVAVD